MGNFLLGSDTEKCAGEAINEIIRVHDIDYERLWGSFNTTDKKLLIGMSESGLTPLSEAFYRKYNLGAPSTVLQQSETNYEKRLHYQN